MQKCVGPENRTVKELFQLVVQMCPSRKWSLSRIVFTGFSFLVLFNLTKNVGVVAEIIKRQLFSVPFRFRQSPSVHAIEQNTRRHQISMKSMEWDLIPNFLTDASLVKLEYGHFWFLNHILPVPVAARSKAQVCGRSPAEIVGSNPTGGMDVCLLCVLCVVRQRSLRRAGHSSRGVLPTVMRRCV